MVRSISRLNPVAVGVAVASVKMPRRGVSSAETWPASWPERKPSATPGRLVKKALKSAKPRTSTARRCWATSGAAAPLTRRQPATRTRRMRAPRVEGESDHEVEQPVRHVDDLLHRPAVHELPHRVVFEGEVHDCGLGEATLDGEAPPDLAVHLDDDLHRARRQQALVVSGPACPEHGLAPAERFPQLLGEMRRVR